MARITCFLIPAVLALCGGAIAQRSGNDEAIKTMGAIPIKDWSPDSSLIVPEHHPAKARYPVIDVHAHVYAKTPAEVAAWVHTMDETGVQTTIILSGATGAEFDHLVDLFLKPYPGRFQLYCGLDTKNIEAPDYPQRAVAELVRCYRKGARGVGEMSDKGSGYTHGAQLPRDKRLHPDDARLNLFGRNAPS